VYVQFPKNDMWCMCRLNLMKMFLSLSAQPEQINLIDESDKVVGYCSELGVEMKCGEKVNLVVIKVNVILRVQRLLSSFIL
jgi:hypothetical protein